MPLVSSPGYSQNEIQRQNRITQRIIENFLERKLFPNRQPQHEVPTIDEILPVPIKDPPRTKEDKGRRRFKPKTALELLRGKGSGRGGGGGGHRSGFKPANPKYSSSRNKSNVDAEQTPIEEEEGDYLHDEEQEAGEEYSDDGDGAVNQEDKDINDSYENYDETEDARSDNTTAEILTGDRGLLSGGDAGGGIGALVDYDDIESLQSVESEHLDLFYRNHQHKRFNNRFYLDEELFDEGRFYYYYRIDDLVFISLG